MRLLRRFSKEILQPSALFRAWLPDNLLQSIASENNLAETAFFVESNDTYDLRWFTPTKEVDLCGHATLAAAHVLFQTSARERSTVTFQSKSGPLPVFKEGELLTLDFPAQIGKPCEAPLELIEGLGMTPNQCYAAMDYMAVYEDEATIHSLSPDFTKLNKLGLRGVIATAPGDKLDFVSHFFAPNYGVNEDHTTGSAHCTLTSYWSQRLGIDIMDAKQLSKRTGTLKCRLENDRVFISGKTVSYLEGFIHINVESGSGRNG